MERKILLVDDEENIVRSLVRLLRRDGYTIFTANSGKEGLELLSENDVGVIISDQRMPEMSGTEFLSQVKDLYPDTIRIVLSGYTDLKTVTDAINDGAIYKFLTKPWEDELLRKNIEDAFCQYELGVENKRLRDELSSINRKLIEANDRLGEDVVKQSRFAEINMKSLQISHEVLEKIPMGVIGFDKNGYIALANLKAHEILLADMNTMVGMSIEQVLPQELLSEIGDEFQGAFCADVALNGRQSVKVIVDEMGCESCSEGKIMIFIPRSSSEAA